MTGLRDRLGVAGRGVAVVTLPGIGTLRVHDYTRRVRCMLAKAGEGPDATVTLQRDQGTPEKDAADTCRQPLG